MFFMVFFCKSMQLLSADEFFNLRSSGRPV